MFLLLLLLLLSLLLLLLLLLLSPRETQYTYTPQGLRSQADESCRLRPPELLLLLLQAAAVLLLLLLRVLLLQLSMRRFCFGVSFQQQKRLRGVEVLLLHPGISCLLQQQQPLLLLLLGVMLLLDAAALLHRPYQLSACLSLPVCC